jgi:hypothetical protein
VLINLNFGIAKFDWLMMESDLMLVKLDLQMAKSNSARTKLDFEIAEFD